MKTMDCQQDEKDDSGIEQDHQLIYIRIHVEDHHLQKVLKFNLDDTIWKAKQKVLQVLVKVFSFVCFDLIFDKVEFGFGLGIIR